jgi:hypothetical protein
MDLGVYKNIEVKYILYVVEASVHTSGYEFCRISHYGAISKNPIINKKVNQIVK